MDDAKGPATRRPPSLLVLFVAQGFTTGKLGRLPTNPSPSLARACGLEGFRFPIEFEFAGLLIERGEHDEAWKHSEKAIAFLQPLGDSVGMRDARAMLATRPLRFPSRGPRVRVPSPAPVTISELTDRRFTVLFRQSDGLGLTFGV